MQERQRAALGWTEGLSDLLVQRHVQKFEAIVVAVHEEAYVLPVRGLLCP